MSTDPELTVDDWRTNLPVLSARLVTLREPTQQDLPSLLDLLSMSDACHFGLDEPLTEQAVKGLIERAYRDREAGLGFTYAVTIAATRAVVGLIQVRQLDPLFEGAEWKCTLTPSWRGTGAFLEAARLVGSFTFGRLGAHRLESRVLLQNGRANGALRKIGAVQEGVLRSAVRRGGQYVDQVLWSVLKDDWGEHWVPTAPRVH